MDAEQRLVVLKYYGARVIALTARQMVWERIDLRAYRWRGMGR